jgi:hypothetical protein
MLWQDHGTHWSASLNRNPRQVLVDLLSARGNCRRYGIGVR